MYFLKAKFEISHFIHGKLVLKAYLKAPNLNEKKTISASELLKVKIYDYFENLEKSHEILTPFQVCGGILNLLHPYCYKCSIKLEDIVYRCEK